MKVGFYLNNENISNTDLSNIEKGNPGIGGSEYLCVLIANELCKRQNIDTILLADKNSKFPTTLKYAVCQNLERALEQYSESIDIFVIDSKRFNIEMAHQYPHTKFILWINNKMKIKEMEQCAKLNNIIKFVHVGREMYDLYRDSWIFPKMTYIYNAISFDFLKDFPDLLPANKRQNKVVYIGSLVPSKGFHLLAKAWRNILKAVPDAELYVIGSGKLYNQNATLGPLGIAEASYEEKFTKYLTDNNTKILPSVHFMGVVGHDKNRILSQCKVGVPNPSGISETFGYTAIEMTAMGCLITTKKCPGYIDTVFNTKLLYNNTAKLSKYIIKLLRNNTKNDYNASLNYIKQNFDISIISSKWEDLILNDCPVYPPSSRSNYRHKNIKEFIRIYVPYYWKKRIPCIESFYENKLANKIRNIKNKIK